jgi:predicted AAA+ superfamily ATPase
MPFMSLKATERQRNPWKVHAVDTGLRTAMALWGSEDLGRGAETVVHAQVRRSSPDGLFWWKGAGEVDLVVQRGIDITEVLQVTWSEGAALPEREIAALREVRRAFPGARRRLVVGPGAAPEIEGAESVSLARFLLEG